MSYQARPGFDGVQRLPPFIFGNPYIPETHAPHPKQAYALGAHIGHQGGTPFEMLYGGAAGGGKSDFLLQAAAQYADEYAHFRGLLLRRTHTELAKAGALMNRAQQWWLPMGAHWDGTNKVIRFPNGATIEFGYHAHPTDDAKFQGGEWHYVGFDELTHWPDESAFEWLKTRLRKADNDPIPLRLYGASNPGGPGHTWVKKRFVGGTDIATGKRYAARSFYLPATIDDNPSLDRDAYKATLSGIHPTRRAQLLDGDWGAREPGDYFRSEWFGPLIDPEDDLGDHIAIRWWDLAASESDSAARTAGVCMARLRSGVRVIKHATAFRATPGKRDAKIVAQAKLDGFATIVGFEIEGGSGGPAQFEAISSRLRLAGFRVVGARPRAHGPELTTTEKATLSINTPSDNSKVARADPVASCLERGHQRRGECDQTDEPWWGEDLDRSLQQQRDGIRLVAGAWTQGYLDEIEGFPGATLKDLVDATSGAWSWLQAHPYGMRHAPDPEAKKPAATTHAVHPEERRDDEDDARDAGGRWTP